jgi:hypothetical protein
MDRNNGGDAHERSVKARWPDDLQTAASGRPLSTAEYRLLAELRYRIRPFAESLVDHLVSQLA